MKYKNYLKKTVASILASVLTIISCSSYPVVADDEIDAKLNTGKRVVLETATKDEIKEFMTEVAYTINTKDSDRLAKLEINFETDAYASFSRYVKLMGLNGSISETQTDTIKPEDSTDGDFVVMTAVKAQYYGKDILYMIELHCNSDGKIYGYNIWTY